MRGALPLALLAAAVALGCGGLPEPVALVRVAGALPSGADVPMELDEASVWFTGPVSPEGLADGRRLVLVPEAGLRDAVEAVESEDGAAGLAGAVPGSLTLTEAGTRVVLRPRAALHPRTAYALVLSSRLRSAEGGLVLDAEGRRRPSVLRFTTGGPAGPPPAPVLTEVRARAASPQAGGEYAEIWNAGQGPLDLTGWRLGKRTSAGGVVSCAISEGVIPPEAVGLVTGGAWDGRYRVPGEAVRVGCGASALDGGLADDRPPEVLLLDPGGAAVATFGQGGVAPVCDGPIVKRDPAGPDTAANLSCADGEGTPGWL